MKKKIGTKVTTISLDDTMSAGKPTPEMYKFYNF